MYMYYAEKSVEIVLTYAPGFGTTDRQTNGVSCTSYFLKQNIVNN